MAQPQREVTELLKKVSEGDQRANSQLFRVVYSELRSIAGHLMRRERAGHELQATALVNEAYIRLFGGATVRIEGSEHFYRLAARAMRFILIDNARKHRAGKREGVAITLHEGLAGRAGNPDQTAVLCLALGRLERQDARAARVVDLHYFSGLELDEIGRSLGVTRRTVERDLLSAKLWLKRELSGTRS